MTRNIEKDTASLIERAIDTDKASARIADKVKKRMAKRGSLGLPPLLEKRRLRYGIPDGAFRVQASYERVLIYGIEPAEQASIEGGSIIMTGTTKDRLRDRSPRGVIISAGLAALDALRTNGMDLGHIVMFTHYVIGTTPVEYVDGLEMKIQIMHAGDITGSEDLQAALRAGEMEIVWNGEQHVYRKVGQKGAPKKPVVPAHTLKSI